MTLEEIRSELEKVNKTDLLEGIAGLINAEKQKGIEEVKKRNSEAQSLRKYKKALESAGLTEEDDLEDFLKNKVKQPQEDSLTLKSLKAELDRVKSERDTERLMNKKKTLQSSLTEALGDKVFGAKYLINTLISEGSFDIVDNEVIYKKGDDHLSFSDGIQEILSQNKDMLRTNMNGGARTNKSDTKPSSLDNIIKSGDPNAIKANFAEIAEGLGLKV